MIVLAIISILIIFFGRRYSVRQQDEMLENSLYVLNGLEQDADGIDEDPEEGSEDDINEGSPDQSDSEILAEYEANSDSLSFVETLHYLALSNGDATVAYYGDINSSDPWYSEMNTVIHSFTDNRVTIEEVTYDELDTYELFIQQTTPNVIEVNPDVIVYGMPALPDKIRDISISDTEQYMTNILNTLIESLPETQIVLLEPHPFPSEMDNLNSRSLDYRSYMSAMNSVADQFDLPVLNVHGQFLAAAEESNSELNTLFNEDGLSLNDNGVELFTQVINTEMSDPLVEETEE